MTLFRRQSDWRRRQRSLLSEQWRHHLLPPQLNHLNITVSIACGREAETTDGRQGEVLEEVKG